MHIVATKLSFREQHKLRGECGGEGIDHGKERNDAAQYGLLSDIGKTLPQVRQWMCPGQTLLLMKGIEATDDESQGGSRDEE